MASQVYTLDMVTNSYSKSKRMSDVDEEEEEEGEKEIRKKKAQENEQERVCFEHAVRLVRCLIGKRGKNENAHVSLSFCILYARLCACWVLC